MVENGGILKASGDGDSSSAMLLKCVEEGRVDVLRSILSEMASKPDYHEVVDGICCDEGTLLHLAVAQGSLDSVRALLASGVNPCIQNDDSRTALQATNDENIKMAFVQELLQAVAMSNLGRVCQMLSSGVPLDAIDSNTTQNTVLHWAASYSSGEVVRTLCESGAAVNAQNAKGETALHDAIRRQDEAVVKILLANGADASLRDGNGQDCYQLASNLGGGMLSVLSVDRVTRTVRRSASIDSEMERASIISTETTSLFVDRRASYANGKLESWTDLLWPQPKFLNLDTGNRVARFPSDGRLKIYFDGASEAEPRRLMQIIQINAAFLSTIKLDLEYRGHKTPSRSVVGKVTLGVFDNGAARGSYTLAIKEDEIELFADDYSGIRYGFATLVQILRLHREGKKSASLTNGLDSSSSQTGLESPPLSPISPSTVNGDQEGAIRSGTIPCLTIRDFPDMCVRAVFQDFSGCKILNTETLLQLATRIGYCKASHLFVNFEVRTTDRYQLPFTNRELFHISQVCDELFVKLVPSLDLQSNYIEPEGARKIVEAFLDDFPLTKVAHFGSNLASILIENRNILDGIQRRVTRIYLSLEVNEKNAALINELPPYVTLCVEGRYPFEAETLLSSRLNVVLRFTTGDPGYLCASPESIAKKAILAEKLGEKLPILGTMMCELSTGCEIMPPSLSYMSEVASLGVSWNKKVDMKRFCFLLPRITAEHVLLDSNMEPLFKQASTIGRVENEITKFSYGLWRPSTNDLNKDWSLSSMSKKTPLSVFVEMILNPDNMTLERLTPVIFKKARIELRRSLKVLDEARKTMPYNFELALVLAEIRLVTELMVLVSRLGQSLCMHGVNPSYVTNGSTNDTSNMESTPIGYHVVNVGVANLPLTVRTDLANSLLDIRSQFQHTWLSRNIASTLPNALKIFDNLFRALLPPSMQDYGNNLL